MRIEVLTLSEWDAALPETGVEAFHLPEVLAVLGEHASGELTLFGAFKGQEPVGLLPVVVSERPLATTILSPPPGFGIHRLGPVVMPPSPKRRKRDMLNQDVIDRLLDEMGIRESTTLFRAVCNAAYPDPRPFVWDAFDVDVQFTYRLGLESIEPDALLGSFSKSLRREIRDAEELDVRIDTEGSAGIREIYEDTSARYEAQGQALSIPWEYVRDLTESLGERCRAYVARSASGEYLSGITVLYSNEAGYFWLGGARAEYRNVSINSLVHWRIVEDIIDDPALETVTTYDLMGANTERLCRYKSKFGAELVPYYVVESGGVGMDIAKRAYRLIAS